MQAILALKAVDLVNLSCRTKWYCSAYEGKNLLYRLSCQCRHKVTAAWLATAEISASAPLFYHRRP